MNDIIKEINDFFGKDVNIIIKNGVMKITVGKKTLLLEMPTVVGAESMGP